MLHISVYLTTYPDQIGNIIKKTRILYYLLLTFVVHTLYVFKFTGIYPP